MSDLAPIGRIDSERRYVLLVVLCDESDRRDILNVPSILMHLLAEISYRLLVTASYCGLSGIRSEHKLYYDILAIFRIFAPPIHAKSWAIEVAIIS